MVTAFLQWPKRSPKQRPKPGARRAVAAALLAAATLTPSVAWSAASGESLRGPDIVIIAKEDRTIYEYRQNGVLRMVRVVPTFGKPYFLVPADPSEGFGDLERADMLVPSWVIVEF